jgi:hypothetical protein
MRLALKGFTYTVKLDPNFVEAYANRSLVLDGLARNYTNSAERRDLLGKAQADPTKAISLERLAMPSHSMSKLPIPHRPKC